MDLVFTILGWIALGIISAYLLAIVCTGDAWFGYCLPYNEETAKLIGTTKDMEV